MARSEETHDKQDAGQWSYKTLIQACIQGWFNYTQCPEKVGRPALSTLDTIFSAFSVLTDRTAAGRQLLSWPLGHT